MENFVENGRSVHFQTSFRGIKFHFYGGIARPFAESLQGVSRANRFEHTIALIKANFGVYFFRGIIAHES